MFGSRKARSALHQALAIASPLAVTDSVEEYVTAMPADRVRELIVSSLKRMDGAERAQLALFLGCEGAQVDEMRVASLPVREMETLVRSCDDLLPNRFAAFLRENPRAIVALGDDAVDAIVNRLQPAISSAPQESTVESERRLSLRTAGFVALAVLLGFTPLVAQYVHQRLSVAGLSDVVAVPPVFHVAAPPVTAAHPARHAYHGVPRVARPARLPHPVVAARPHHVRVKHVVFHPIVRKHPVEHVAGNWKLDPRNNRLVRHRAPVAGLQRTPPKDRFQERAGLMVQSYLNDVIGGNRASALRHLGLPANAPVSNISESPIIGERARAQVVGFKKERDGQTGVQVDITSTRGEYFEVFYVAQDGDAMRILDRYYIPVNRTAEEMAARLLAKDGH
jgi:hypothetical protein